MRFSKKVQAAMKGDKEALIQLIMLQKDDYYGLAYSFLRNEHDAMDACEEMIIVVYEQIQYLKKPDSFYSWSKTILANICKKMLLKRSKETISLNVQREQWEDIDKFSHISESQQRSFGAIEIKIDLEEAVKQLPKDTQQIIKLKYWYDLELQHVAEIMGMPLGTIKSRLHYAKKQLYKIVERGEEHE